VNQHVVLAFHDYVGAVLGTTTLGDEEIVSGVRSENPVKPGSHRVDRHVALTDRDLEGFNTVLAQILGDPLEMFVSLGGRQV
jgi:hypothetical protein